MTDEEMKEIDMARRCGHSMEVEFIDNKDAFTIGYKSFLAGLKAGRPQWHDLRKDPNDLPNDDRVVSEQKGENVRYVKHRNKWFYLDRIGEANVIAWCEIPKFDKE